MQTYNDFDKNWNQFYPALSLSFHRASARCLAREQSLKTESTSRAAASSRERLSLYSMLSIGADEWNVSSFRYALPVK
jgi:hypothetical protein